MDLDLLLYDRLVLRTPGLEVPHPRMAWRRFVLEPAAEIAAEMIHPATGWTIARLLAHLDATRPYVAFAGPIGVGKTHLADLFVRRAGAAPVRERFDTARLETFYAEPAGNAWNLEIEFLSQREGLLAADGQRWSQSKRLWVSDFWFDQSLAYAAVWLPPDKMEPFGARWQQARSRVEPPKLTVLLDAPTETLLERIRRRGRRAEQGLAAAQLDRIRKAILALAEEPGHGPILRLVADDAERVFEEAAAAIEATGLKVERGSGDATS